MSASKPVDQSSPQLFPYQESVCPAPESQALLCSVEDLDSYSTQILPKAPNSNLAFTKGALAYFGSDGASSAVFAFPVVAPGFGCSSFKDPPPWVKKVGGVFYQEKTLKLHPNGKVANGELFSDAAIQGNKLNAGDRVYFSADGRLEMVEFEWSQEIQGIEWRGSGEKVVFYPNGKVSIGTLFGHENKYGNKHPEIEVLGEEVVWQEDTDLSLYPNGNVEWGYLAYEQQIQGVYMAASVWDGDMGLLALRDVWVSFYPGGQLKSGFVGEKSASLLGLNPGDEISFATNGKVKSSD